MQEKTVSRENLDFDTVDYYKEAALINDPNPYFEYLRAHSPVHKLPHRNIYAVTGYEEAVQVFNDTDTFSALVASSGPFPRLPIEPADDITDQLDRLRPLVPMSDIMMNMDWEDHARNRSLVTRLFTPRRLKQNEEYLRGLADRIIDTFADKGRLELVRDFGAPYTGMAIADLLGVPEEDRGWFYERFNSAPVLAPIEDRGNDGFVDPLGYLEEKFTAYVRDRRDNPRNDVLNEVANATFPDGTLPPLEVSVRTATNLFAAGLDTTARLLASLMQILAEDSSLQARLRSDPKLVPDFVEEGLRLEGPVKTGHRLVLRNTELGGVTLPAGSIVALMNGAMNRDPRRFEAPSEFRLGRRGAREHLAFGRGSHTCPGAALARAENQVAIEHLLGRLGEIRVSEEKHGPPGARRFTHEPTYILRGLQELHLEFTPISRTAKS